MKKIMSSLLITILVTSTSLFASKKENSLAITVSQQNILEDDSLKMIGIEYEMSKTTDSNIYLAMNYKYEGGNLETEEVTGYTFGGDEITENSTQLIMNYGLDIKIGYLPADKILVYGLVGVKMQSLGETGAAGFGYGAGVGYRLAENFSINFNYDMYSLTVSETDVQYDNDSATLLLKVIW